MRRSRVRVWLGETARGSGRLDEAVANAGTPTSEAGTGNHVNHVLRVKDTANEQKNPPQSLSYCGGPVTSNVEVVQVNWNASVDPTIMNGMGGFYSAFTKSELFPSIHIDYATNINANAGFTRKGQPGTNQQIGKGSFGRLRR